MVTSCPDDGDVADRTFRPRRAARGTGQGVLTQARLTPVAGNVVQRCGATPCLACSQDDDRSIMRRRATGSAEPSSLPPVVREALPSSGLPLEPSVRSYFEPRFGRDFSTVRVHTDERAARAADAIDASAFTVGSSIWFGRGMYQPAAASGQRLLAHELAHTIQQHGRTAAQRSLRLGAASDPAEAAADRVADAVLAGNPVPQTGSGGLVIRRAPKVSPVPNDPSQRSVEMDDGSRYRVRRIIDPQPHRTTTSGEEPGPSFTPKIDNDKVWLQVDWCTPGGKGDYHPQVQIGANVPAAAEAVLGQIRKSILDGSKSPDEVLREARLKLFASVNITQSGRFTAGLTGGPTVQPATGKVTGGQLEETLHIGNVELSAQETVSEPPGGAGRKGPDITVGVGIRIPLDPPRKVTCQRIVVTPRIIYECEKIVPAHDEPRKIPVTHRQTHYFYFEYAKPEFARRGRTATLDAQGKAALRQALDAGYRVDNIRGYASPEGPEPKGPVDPVTGFHGNAPLSDARAVAADKWIRGICPAPSALSMRPGCFAEGYRRSGGGELYGKGPEGAELKGRELAQSSVQAFETEPAEEPRRTRDVMEELGKGKTPQRQVDTVWPLLRRAEIDVSKQATETRTETVPESAVHMEECPAEVIRAVADDFDRQPAATK